MRYFLEWLNIADLLVPFVQFGEVLRELAIVHQLHLVEFAEENKVNDGKTVACHVFMFLQLCINLFQELLLQLMKPQVESLLRLLITGLGSCVRLNDEHGAPLDELARVTANLSIEVSLHSCHSIFLSFVYEYTHSTISCLKDPIMKNPRGSDDLSLSVDDHGNLLGRIDISVLFLEILLLQRIDASVVVRDIGVPAHGNECTGVRAEHISVDLKLAWPASSRSFRLCGTATHFQTINYYKNFLIYPL